MERASYRNAGTDYGFDVNKNKKLCGFARSFYGTLRV